MKTIIALLTIICIYSCSQQPQGKTLDDQSHTGIQKNTDTTTFYPTVKTVAYEHPSDKVKTKSKIALTPETPSWNEELEKRRKAIEQNIQYYSNNKSASKNQRVTLSPPNQYNIQRTTSKSSLVSICNSSSSYAYHTHDNCRWLNRCKNSTIQISLEDALGRNRKLCKTCSKLKHQ